MNSLKIIRLINKNKLIIHHNWIEIQSLDCVWSWKLYWLVEWESLDFPGREFCNKNKSKNLVFDKIVRLCCFETIESEMRKTSNKLTILLLLCCFAAVVRLQITPGVDPISARVMPKPKNYTYGDHNLPIIDACGITYKPHTPFGIIPSHVLTILAYYSLNLMGDDSRSGCNYSYHTESKIESDFEQSMKAKFSSNRRLQRA